MNTRRSAYRNSKPKAKRVPALRGFKGISKEKDRWPDQAPTLSSLKPGDLAYFMRSGLQSGMLTEFERGIAQAVLDRLKSGRGPSEWHKTMLDERGVLARCWDCDLELWNEKEQSPC
jgi:hypothetical protein